MIALSSTLLALCPLMGPSGTDPGLVAIRVTRAESIANGTLEHAVILIEGGKIVTVGEDLPIERGIPVIDLDPTWVVMPGLVNAYSRIGMDGQGGSDSVPQVLASSELYPGSKEYERVLAAGVTTLGLYAPGNGIPGQTVAVRPHGDKREEMILSDSVYLKIVLRANASSKKMLRDGFDKADKHAEKEKKEREKWEKEKEKKDKKKKDEKKEEKKEGEESGEAAKTEALGPFVPPTPDPDVKAFIDLRAGSLRALMAITDAADFLHMVDAIGKETFYWDVRIPVQRDSNVFYVAKEVGTRARRVVIEPQLSLHPNTMRLRNLPAEFHSAGAKLVFVPRSDDVEGHREWLRAAGEIVATGLPREAALRAMTLEPAELLGLGARLGSLEAGKDANLLFLDGDPFETDTEIKAVMLEGRIVTGEVKL